MDDNERYEFVYSEKGKRFHSSKPGHRSKRLSMIGALVKNTLIAPFMFSGHCETNTFEYYVEHILSKVLKPGHVLVIDNASFHKSKKIIEIIEGAGCKVLFLPPYSPDLNPIEHWWFKVKNKIKKWIRDKKESLERSMEQVLKHLSVY